MSLEISPESLLKDGYPQNIKNTHDIVRMLFKLGKPPASGKWPMGLRSSQFKYDHTLSQEELEQNVNYQNWVKFATAFEKLYTYRIKAGVGQGTESRLIYEIVQKMDEEPDGIKNKNESQKALKALHLHQIELLNSMIINAEPVGPPPDIGELDEAVNEAATASLVKEYENIKAEYEGLTGDKKPEIKAITDLLKRVKIIATEFTISDTDFRNKVNTLDTAIRNLAESRAAELRSRASPAAPAAAAARPVQGGARSIAGGGRRSKKRKTKKKKSRSKKKKSRSKKKKTRSKKKKSRSKKKKTKKR
jgi:hypothetical protein